MTLIVANEHFIAADRITHCDDVKFIANKIHSLDASIIKFTSGQVEGEIVYAGAGDAVTCNGLAIIMTKAILDESFYIDADLAGEDNCVVLRLNGVNYMNSPTGLICPIKGVTVIGCVRSHFHERFVRMRNNLSSPSIKREEVLLVMRDSIRAYYPLIDEEEYFLIDLI